MGAALRLPILTMGPKGPSCMHNGLRPLGISAPIAAALLRPPAGGAGKGVIMGAAKQFPYSQMAQPFLTLTTSLFSTVTSMSSHKQPQIGHVTELITVIFIAQIPSSKVLLY